MPVAPLECTTDACRSMTATIFGREYTVAVNPISLDHGLMVWDASMALLRFFEHNPKELSALRGARILELGAGTGLLGIALAHAVGAHVVLTDLEHVCANIAANVRANALPPGAPGSVRVAPYSWSGEAPPELCAHGPFDFIIGTDVAYSESLNPTLIASAAAFAAASAPRCTVFFANELRCSIAQGVFDAEWPKFFTAKRIAVKLMHPEWRDKNMIFFKMRLRRKRAGVSAGGGPDDAGHDDDDGGGEE
jgi:predicted nicotinamide N-methyase